MTRRCAHRYWLLILLFLSVQPCHSFLRQKGKDIVDSTGQKVLLRGFGLGGWLVPEGYQLHIPGFGSPTFIRDKIIDLIGQTNADQVFQLYRDNYVTEEDIQQIASWSLNSIRLPFNYRLISPEDQPGVFLEEGFQVIDRVLEWCENNNLYLILDMHCAPGGQNKDNISDSDGIEARLWTEPSNQDRTIEIWRKIAERYANEDWIGGYDLLDEPVLPSGYPNTDLRLLYMRITQAIREVDPNHIVFIEGNWYATDFNSLTPPWDANLVYSFHKYWNENTRESIQSFLNIRNQYKIPFWLGESGENSNPWFSDCVRLMEANDIGWCWWMHKKVQTITSPYSSPISEKYQRILEYWNGHAARPSMEYSKEALLEMADNLLLDKCEFHPAVLDALLRSDYSSEPKPFREHHIPGTIASVDYDLGNVNVSYFDTDYQNTKGLGGAQWNKGWKYRNDGVDIELSDDANGAKYNVGWIENGEWLLYAVTVNDSRQYDVDFRVASPNSSGKLQLILDDQPVTNAISIPSTGGSKNWQTITASNISISAGTLSLKLLFTRGGFNINYLRFRPSSSANRESHLYESVTSEVFVAQNYPNPFNSTTQIPIFFSQPNRISLRIYTSQGTLVKNLYDGVPPSGFDEILWDGTDSRNHRVASGIYFYQLNVNGAKKTKAMVLQK